MWLSFSYTSFFRGMVNVSLLKCKYQSAKFFFGNLEKNPRNFFFCKFFSLEIDWIYLRYSTPECYRNLLTYKREF